MSMQQRCSATSAAAQEAAAFGSCRQCLFLLFKKERKYVKELEDDAKYLLRASKFMAVDFVSVITGICSD